jgi:hypothetical protein
LPVIAEHSGHSDHRVFAIGDVREEFIGEPKAGDLLREGQIGVIPSYRVR